MKSKLLLIIITAITLLSLPKVNFGQAVAPNLGTTVNFALFSSAGAMQSTSIPKFLTHITGNIGAAPASVTGFGNVDGVVYQGGTQFATASTDLLAAYTQLSGEIPTNVLASPFGGGSTLTTGVYRINAASQLTGNLTLDAVGVPGAVFIFQLKGALGVSNNVKIKLINGALACNVFWEVDGAISMGTGIGMKGTIIANAGRIDMGANDTLEGRALVINEAVGILNTVIYLPIGCGSAVLTGPSAPNLASTECYGIFSSDGGNIQDDAGSFVTGDIGTNGASFSSLGYDPLKVTGTIHNPADASTALCASDLGNAYAYINGLAHDILLLEPTLFGHDLVLTPHTYRIDGAVTFTDSLYLNAQGNANAIFIIKVYGAFNSSTNSKVVLMNGAQAKNVYWMINGAVSIGKNSIFNGTFICAGAIDLLLGTTMNGRAFTTAGVINTFSIKLAIPSGKAAAAGAISGSASVCQGQTGVIYSVPLISSATGYIWTLPAGATITAGTNTNSITVSFSGAAVSGTITVQGSSSCSNGTVSANFAVTVNPLPTVNSVPNQTVCNNALTSTVVFSGSVPGATYIWTNSNTSIGLSGSGSGNISSFTATNTGTIVVTATITVTPTANGCTGASTSFTITVNPTPTVNVVPNQALCNNAPTAAVTFSGSVPGATYIWTNSNTSIGLSGSGSGNISSFTATNTGTIVVTATITVTPTANGCTGASTNFTITVSPTPTINGVANQALCNNAPTAAVIFSGGVAGTTYNWTNSNTSIGLAGSGSGNISSFTAINTGTSTVTATITVTPTANGCTGTSTSFTITVDPTPAAAGTITGPAAVCKGQTGLIYSVPVITNATGYTWTLPAGATITAGINTNSITVSFSGAAVSGTITVQGSNGCGNGVISPNFVIAVSAAPAAAAGTITGPATVCEGQTGVIYTVPVIANATGYIWTLPAGATITAGTNTNSITVDYSGTAVSGTITVQGTSGCGNGAVSPNFAVTVNSLPTVNNVPNQTVCNNAPTSAVTFSGAVAGTTYTWTNSDTSIGLGASGSGNISSFTATNTGTVVITATITVTPTANGCAGTSTNFTITVNPTPTVNSVFDQVLCNNASTFPVTFSGGLAGTIYNWTNSNTSIGLGASGSGNISSFTATTTGTTTVTATITVTPTLNGCNGASTSFTITVSPTPTVNGVASQALCNNSTTSAVIFSGGLAGTTYNWTNSNTSIGLAGSGSGNIGSFTATITGTTTVTATITVTPTLNGCNGASTSFTITVNPKPFAIASSNSPVCAGSSINLTAQTVTGGTCSWTGPNGYLSSAQNPVILAALPANAGVYSLIVSTNGCISTPSTATVVVNNCGGADLSVVKTVNNTHPLVGRSVVFTISVTNNGPNNATGVVVTDVVPSGYTYVSSSSAIGSYDPSTGVWTIGTLSNGSSKTLTVTAIVNSAGNYVNTATIKGNELDGNMANNESSTTTFPTSLNIPEGFSPNSDGINDVLVIRGIEFYANNTFVIFNRWGDKVFDASSYLNTWDGKSNTGLKIGGDELPIGTYFYILDLGDGSAIFKGTIYLNR